MTGSRNISGSKKRSAGNDPAGAERQDTNVGIIVGTVARDSVTSESNDGTFLTSFDVVCRTEDGRTVVPVTVESDCSVSTGQTVAVTGRVHKRFFASGGGLSSRTDVRADRVTVVKRRDQVRRVVSAVIADLGS